MGRLTAPSKRKGKSLMLIDLKQALEILREKQRQLQGHL
jgi:hypothetical protein